MKSPKNPHPAPAAIDPLWYKDAVIYQLHVKSFFDSNGDGIGDFPGLISKLDYISHLGADVIWLLPFYPSPRRDDGYDIADYRGVNPDYGTMSDVRRFIAEAHKRGIKVITELVINHTSDQHPWFQRARAAKPGSAARNYYVWSDTDQKYADTRIIFVDSEKSNWTWDPVAGAYFWHRFYSHQPDLNFDNPQVMRAVLEIMRFWLDQGVDGLRLDAVPYLIEREGTNNENLPETHDILKRIRSAMDEHAPGRMLLAEANQWPEDAQQYFGDGDECHMSFHFPLMPRMYMAIAQEDRFPISDIMRQTPAIPETCQWAIFLRNHDELTLEMVTDSERDYLWNTYAADRQARINLGIRRRLAPLLEHDRRRMELMNGLLLSMPGTPVIYYGDEIGMGDNIHLGDRDGVRTPMQWSPDRNGGFSRASPESLVLPPIMDAIYGFAAINVEAQDRDRHSLLNWTRKMLAVRRGHPAFGRGMQRFLYPANRKVLAFLREYEGETILCVSNLASTAQAVELDLAGLAGRTPVDLLGGSAFPMVGQLPYLLTMPPYAFYWFILATEADLPGWYVPAPEPLRELATLVLRRGLTDLLEGAVRHVLEAEALPPYLARRRWFGSKDEPIIAVRLVRAEALTGAQADLMFAEVELDIGNAPGFHQETYLLPLCIVWEDAVHAPLAAQLALARVRNGRRVGFLTDAFVSDALPLALIRAMREAVRHPIPEGEISFIPTDKFADIVIADAPEIRRMSAEQSNSSMIVGDAVMIKLIRHISPGIHPESEMARYLTAQNYLNTPPMFGEVVRTDQQGLPHTLIVMQGFVRNQGDAWGWTQEFIARNIDELALSESSAEAAADRFSAYETIAAALGKRLAELHIVLARPSDNPAFAPERATKQDAQHVAADTIRLLTASIAAIDQVTTWPDDTSEGHAQIVKSHVPALMNMITQQSEQLVGSLKTRIHGDFHLGQVLVAQSDVYLIDFEGEPARSLDERRAKSHRLRDVAGILRSFDYAVAAGAVGRVATTARAIDRRPALLEQFRKQAVAAFMSAYRAEYDEAQTPQPHADESRLLNLFLLQKTAYEICYEAANRPAWLPIPLRGLAELAETLTSGPAS
jgi:maltose alpha-D-glucosyltransferase/alpha-amylase